MTTPPILMCGNCERLKAATHTLALVTAAVCGVYNLSAWLVRRQRHLAINAIVYGAAIGWEIMHVQHHLAEMNALAVAPVRVMPAPNDQRVA